MMNTVRKCWRALHIIILSALIAACGSDKKNPISNDTDPEVFYAHSVLFKGSGSAFTCGANLYGQLGDGNDDREDNKSTPVQVVGAAATGVRGVATGATHSLAFLSADGSVYAWGNNGNGQLGTGTSDPKDAPTHVVKTDGSPLTGITAVSAGALFSLALDQSGQVWAWGDNSNSQLGPITTESIQRSAVQLTAPAGVTSFSAISAGGAHGLALSGDRAFSWGRNAEGQLGFDTSSAAKSATPGIVRKESGGIFGPELTNVTEIAGGGSHSLFLLGDGTVWACGYNHYGQLGTGDTTNRSNGVVQVQSLPGTVTHIAAGLDHSLALINGEVWAWGLNFYGQLGNPLNYLANNPNVLTPVQVLMSNGSPLTNIVMIIAIGNHSLAVDGDGQLWSWGNNNYGQLGIGDTDDETTRQYATKVPSFATGSFGIP